jgi:hypothetical protein
MASRVTRDHHNFRRTVSLNGNKISNDGGDEGISVADNGNTTLSGDLDIDGSKITSAGALEIDPGGRLSITGQHVNIDATQKLYLDGGTDTYIYEHGADNVRFVVGDEVILTITENGGGASDSVAITATTPLYLDGGNNTYIHEVSADKLEIVVGADEMLTLDEANQRVTIEADKLSYAIAGGTEFSAADSAYAGMILGYTRIQNTGSGTFDSLIALTSSMTVLQTVAGTNVGVTFVGPPSGNVEIIFTCYLYTSQTTVGFALSDNATFNEVDPDHTYDKGSYKMDETDFNTISISWAVTGLTAGTSYTYYIGGDEIAGSTAVIYHGDSRGTGDHYPPITVKAIALPATITTGS